MSLHSKFGVITGGTGALGGSLALACLKAGGQVAVTYIAEPGWQRLREQAERQLGSDGAARLEGVRVDLTDSAASAAALEPLLAHHAGGVDFLACVAGGFQPGSSYGASDEVWQAMLQLNLHTAVNAIRPLAPAMIARQSGCIVTISSAAILNAPGAGIAAYAVSKEAVRRLSEILAVELRPHGIAVHCVLPGTMDTPANRHAMPGTDPSVWLKTETVAERIRDLVDAAGSEPRPVLVPIMS